MRIVGGRLRGRTLLGPSPERGSGTERLRPTLSRGAAKQSPDASHHIQPDIIRPTSDRLRETIFNVLAHAYDDAVVDARVIDLFAGTGAMGIEALSRGAAFALFVDDAAAAGSLIRANTDKLGLGAATQFIRRDATRMGKAGANAAFSLVFCDPPYGLGLAGPALASCAAGGWLAPGALVLVEDKREAAFTLPDGFAEEERRPSGKTEIVIGRFR